MKNKILNAIDKGLLNALSSDIADQDIDFDKDDIDSKYVLTLDGIYEIYTQNHANVFHISVTDYISFILYDGTEIPLSKYNKSLYPAFLKISNDDLRKTDNEIFVFCESTHFITTDITWQNDKDIDIQDFKYMTTKKSIAESDYNGYETCKRIQNYIEKQNLSADTPSINHCMSIVSPVKGYKGYLPSLGQLKMIFDYIDMLNYIFIEIGSTNIKMDTDYWWSSTEFPYGFAWCLSYGEIAHISKNNANNCNAFPLFKKLN